LENPLEPETEYRYYVIPLRSGTTQADHGTEGTELKRWMEEKK
jgi:hypothetical protein